MSADVLSILIPTCGRASLLDRTLKSLSHVDDVDRINRVIVVENDTVKRLRCVVDQQQSALPLQYVFYAQRNKSLALNCGLKLCESGLVLFLDDDIRVDRRLITSYLNAMSNYPVATFFGGPFEIDYEQEPNDWLLPLMTMSTTGWSLGGSDQWANRRVCFSGCNWAAYKDDLLSIGGFDGEYGPGAKSGATGQESNAQRRLHKFGVRARYLSDARVWHYVTADQIEPAWIIGRRRRSGKELGQIIVDSVPKPLRQTALRFALILLRAKFGWKHTIDSRANETYNAWWNAYRNGAQEVLLDQAVEE